MFCLQPSDPVAPGWFGLDGRKRLGRPSPGTGRGVDTPQSPRGRPSRLLRADNEYLPTDGNPRDVPTGVREEAPQQLGPVNRHSSRVGRIDGQVTTDEDSDASRDLRRSGAVYTVGIFRLVPQKAGVLGRFRRQVGFHQIQERVWEYDCGGYRPHMEPKGPEHCNRSVYRAPEKFGGVSS